MRDITFRGRRTDNGEWTEGNLVWIKNCNNEPYQCFIISHLAYMEYGEFDDIYKVLPETIGQYTGLTDKNGKKVFEGDIVKTQPFYDKPYSDKRKAKQFIGVVTYKVSTFKGNRFYSSQDYSAEWGLKFNEDFGKFTHYSWDELWNCEVIGNIHDNKELLEVK